MNWVCTLRATIAAVFVFAHKMSAQVECGVEVQDLIFVDTVVIESAVILRFDHLRYTSYSEANVLLLPLCMVDSLRHANDRIGFSAYLKAGGFLFFHPDQALNAIEHSLYRFPNAREAALLQQLALRLASMSEDRVYRFDYRKTDTLTYYEMTQAKYWFFLVRLEAYNRLQPDGKILPTGDKNEYLRVVVPVTR